MKDDSVLEFKLSRNMQRFCGFKKLSSVSYHLPEIIVGPASEEAGPFILGITQ